MREKPFTTILESLDSFQDSENIAAICGEEKITYRELVADAKHIARGLLAEGVKKGDRVLFAFPCKLDAFRAILGILYAGASYVAADPNWPQERTDFVLKDTGAVFSMTEETCRLLREKEPTSVELPEVNGEDEAAIYYTSGSTGQPKGVVLYHIVIGRMLLNCIYVKDDGLTDWQVFQCMFKLPFIAALIDFCVAFFTGKTAFLPTDEEQASVELLAAAMKRNKTDIFAGTPSSILRYMENPDIAGIVPELKSLSFGGERLVPNVIHKVSLATKGKLVITYGASEMLLITEYIYRGDMKLYLGYTAYGVELHLLDENMEEVQPGEEGELFVGGVPAKYGHYLNRPDLDAEKYVDHPKFGRLFRTGDTARLETNGEITMIGRSDGMVKLHGQRIEIGEIESALENFSGVRRAAVKLVKESGHEILAAYYTVSQDVSETELRKYLADRLPYYMVPSAFMKLEDMPENDHGKLDYRALPKIEMPTQEYAPPETEEEKLLCEIFAESLNIKNPVGVNDNFFALGGDSISGMLAAYRLGRYGFSFEIRRLFTAPTARQLAPLLVPVTEENISPEKSVLPEPTSRQWEKIEKNVGRENVECVYPIAHAAEDKLKAGDTWMQFHMVEVDSEDMTLEKLKERLTEMTEKHQTLRSVFLLTEGDFLQIVLRRHEPDIFFADISTLGEGEKISSKQKAYLRNLVQMDTARPCDLEREVAFRAGLIKTSDKKNIVYISFSHFLMDGTGMACVMREIVSDEEIRPDKKIWEKRFSRLASSKNAASVDYWKKLLDGCQGFTRLPQKTGATGQVSPAGHYVMCERKLYEQTEKYCVARKITPAALTHYVFGKALMKILSVDEVCFCSMGSGRTADDLELLGMTAVYFPVRLRSGDSLSDCQAQLLSSVAHTDLWENSVPDFVTSWGKCPFILDIQNFFSVGGKKYGQIYPFDLSENFGQNRNFMRQLFRNNVHEERLFSLAEVAGRIAWTYVFNEERYEPDFVRELAREVIKQLRKIVGSDVA